MGLTTICVKYCCSSSWNTELGGRPRRFAAAPRGPLRAGLLPLLPLLRLRAGLAGVVGAGGATGAAGAAGVSGTAGVAVAAGARGMGAGTS